MRSPFRALFIVAGLVVAGPAEARTQVLETHAGSVVHWSRPEISVGIDGSAGSRNMDRLDVVLAIQRAVRTWNQILADQPRLHFTSERRHDVTVRFCSGAWQGDTVDLGRTQYSASPVDGSIAAAIVELNECDHKLTPPGAEAGSPFDVQSVLTHEIGHVLGIGHSNERSSIMFPSGNGILSRTPSPEDIAALGSIYLGREETMAAVPTRARPAASSAPEVPVDLRLAARPEAARPEPAAETPTPGAVPVLNLKANHGRDVIVYTTEPTLLPPLAASPPVKLRKPSATRAKAR